MNNKYIFGKGYVALSAILIISFILISVIFTTGFEGYFSLTQVSNREKKEISLNQALSCADQAMVNIAQRPNWLPEKSKEYAFIEQGYCQILNIDKVENDIIILVLGEYQNIYTKLQVVFDLNTFKIKSFNEI